MVSHSRSRSQMHRLQTQMVRCKSDETVAQEANPSHMKRRLFYAPPIKLGERQSSISVGHLAEHDNCASFLPPSSVREKCCCQISRVSDNEPNSSPMSTEAGRRGPSVRQMLVRSAVLALLLASVGNCDTEIHIQRSSEAPPSGVDRALTRAARSIPTPSHKEKLIRSVAESIERQHSQPVQQRQANSDSGQSSSVAGQESRLTAKSALSNNAQVQTATRSSLPSISRVANNLPDSYLKLYEAHEKSLPVVKWSKSTSKSSHTSADSPPKDMQQIMQMHEQTPLSARPAEASGNKLSGGLWNRQLLESSHASTKAIKSILSLWSPSSPSANSSSSAATQSASGLSKAQATTAKGKAARLNQAQPSSQFSSRKSQLAVALQKQLMGPLLGLGQMMLTSDGARKHADLIDTSSQATLLEPANVNADSFRRRSPGSLLSGPTKSAGAHGGPEPTELSPSDAQSGATTTTKTTTPTKSRPARQQQATVSSWLKKGASQLAQSYLQDSLRDWLTLSQLPILSGAPVSTAPSELEPGGKQWLAQRAAAQQARGNRTQALDDFLRYAYIFGSGVRRKRDPLKVLGPPPSNAIVTTTSRLSARRPARLFTQKKASSTMGDTSASHRPGAHSTSLANLGSALMGNRNAKPRGVMWDMATDPTLAVTVLHLIERASLALPLGFMLMPFVQMVRTNPLHHIPIDLARILPARASHRSVDYEELAKHLVMMDKLLSRALRPTHREA